MSKPRLFIGSSIEGLNVAYAIQENLRYVTEATVWDQGVFNLSETSIESLLSILEASDFGVFVFTPDDYLTIRGKKDLTVRDNVLFELGLFIGRLGKERCFIVVPDNKEFHLPTDLIGLTTAKYEAVRSDGNIHAGAGSASNKIREKVLKLGGAQYSKVDPELRPELVLEQKEVDKDKVWIEELFVKKNYDNAINLLKKRIKYEKDADYKLSLKGNVCYAEFQKNAQLGKIAFKKLIFENETNNLSYWAYANALFSSNAFAEALEVIDTGLKLCSKKISLLELKVDCLCAINKNSDAIDCLLESIKNIKDPSLFIKISTLYDSMNQKNEALNVLYKGFIEYPNNEEILYQFARLAYDIGHKDVCILIFKELISINKDNPNYWCLLGNAYFDLDFDNLALTAYEKANELSNGKENWILSNIGNLFNNKKLYDKAEYYLLLAQKKYDKSEYTLSRLSSIYQIKDSEAKRLDEVLKIAKSKIAGQLLVS